MVKLSIIQRKGYRRKTLVFILLIVISVATTSSIHAINYSSEKDTPQNEILTKNEWGPLNELNFADKAKTLAGFQKPRAKEIFSYDYNFINFSYLFANRLLINLPNSKASSSESLLFSASLLSTNKSASLSEIISEINHSTSSQAFIILPTSSDTLSFISTINSFKENIYKNFSLLPITQAYSLISLAEENENQYKGKGVSSNLPVLGSTLNPKVSKTTTPNKTLLTKSEIHTSKGASLSSTFIQALPLPTFTNPAPVETLSSLITLISNSSASSEDRVVKVVPISTKALTFFDFVLSKFDISISTQECPIFFSDNNISQNYLNISPTPITRGYKEIKLLETPLLSNDTYEIDLILLNVKSYPQVGGNWTVAFETKGKADLTITASNGTSWSLDGNASDLQFLEIRCRNQTLNYSWVNNSVFIANYSCDQTSYETSKVLTSGKHVLKFKFGSIVKYAENQAEYEITNCSTLNESGAIYYLTQDIINSTQSYCINISANDITLDCQGHLIDGDDAADCGIYISRSSVQTTNITIKNCRVSDWDGANIYLRYANGNTLENITVSSAPAYGILLSYSDSNFLSNLTVTDCGSYGILLGTSDNNTVTNSKVWGNGYGIGLISAGADAPNLIYNNLFNQTTNFNFLGTRYSNQWNVTKQKGNNIYNPNNPYIGGNLWAKPDGTGFSQTCNDTDKDGFCDEPYTLETDNVDYLPLSDEYSLIYLHDLNYPEYIDIDKGKAIIKINVTSRSAQYNISQVWIEENSTGTFVNHSMTLESGDKKSGIWNYTLSFSNLGTIAFRIYANNTKGDVENTTLYYIHVQNISISVATDKSLYNPGENITVSGKVILLPNNTNVSNTNVSIWLDNVFQLNCTTDSYGNYSCNITAPSESGTHTITVNLTTEQGISGENSTTFMSNNLPVVEEPKTYSESLVEKTSFEQNEKVVIRVNVTDPDGAEQIDKVLINITSANGNMVVENAEMVNVSSIPNGYVFEYNYTLTNLQSDEFGTWQIKVWANDTYSQSNLNSSSFEVINTPPSLEGISYECEQDCGWGERWIYKVNLTEPNNNTVNVSFWYSYDGSTWVYKDSEVISCPPAGCYNITINFTFDPGWEASDADQTRYYKFNASDGVGGTNETSQSVLVQKDDAIAVVIEGSDAIARRWGEEKTLFRIRINDTDRNVWVGEGVNCTFYFTKDGSTYSVNLENQTDSLGYCSIYLKPNCSYSVGAQHWKGGITDQAYKLWNTTEQNYSVKGKLTINIESPSAGEKLYKTYVVNLNSSLVDDCSQAPTQSYSVTWYNETWSEIASGEDATWQIPADYEVGPELIRVNASGTYYDENTSQVLVYIYGFANISEMLDNSTNDKPVQGEVVRVLCRVLDANSSKPIENYPVNFSVDGTQKEISLTNASGYAEFLWNTSEESLGYHTVKCEIRDNGTLYYNASYPSSMERTFQVTKKPVIETIKTYLENGTETSVFFTGEDVIVRANVTDEEGASDISSVKVKVVDGTTALDWSDMTKIADIPNGGTYEKTVSSGLITRGTWHVYVKAIDSHGYETTNSTTFKVIAKPELQNLDVTPTSAGWGETFVFSFELQDLDNDTVEVTLKEKFSDGEWQVIAKHNFTDTESFTVRKFYINSTHCMAESPSGIEPANYCIGHNYSMIGLREWQLIADDHWGRGVTEVNASVNFTIEKDDIAIEYVEGNQSIIDRNEGYGVLKVRIKDLDKGVWAEGVNANLFVTTDGTNFKFVNSTFTDSQGFANITFVPNEKEFEVGEQKWKVGVLNEEAYKDKNSSEFVLTLVGDIFVNLTYPAGEQFVAGKDKINFTWNLVDENQTSIVGASNSVEVKLNTSSQWQSIACTLTDFNNGTYQCSWEIPEEQEIGWYDVRINASKTYYHDNSSVFEERFEVLTSAPELEDLRVEVEEDGGWGERWIYRVNLTEINPDIVNVSLWYNRTGTWELVNSTNITCPCSDFVVEFVQDPGWEASDVGTRWIKINATDYKGGSDETASQSVEVKKDDLVIEHIAGNGSSVDRKEGSTLLKVLVKDSDRDQELNGSECNFFATYDFQNFTKIGNATSNPYCELYFDPNCTFEEGIQLWKVNISESLAYKSATTLNFTVEILGSIFLTLDNPSQGSRLYKNQSYSLNSSISFDCSDSNALIEWFVNSSKIGEGEDIEWEVPLNHSLGVHELRVNASKSYYHANSSAITVEIWGNSSVDVISPSPGNYDRGVLTIECKVIDLNGSAIANYPVEILVNETSIANVTTNASGITSFDWDNHLKEPGSYNITCKIKENSTLFYTPSKAEDSVSINLYGMIYANVTLAPESPGPVDRNEGGNYNTSIQWNITNIRDENENPLSDYNLTLTWREQFISNQTNGSFDIPNDNPLGQDNDTVKITIEKPYYHTFIFESSDYKVLGVINLTNLTWYTGVQGNWFVSPEANATIDNFAEPLFEGNLVNVSYEIKDMLGNLLVEGVDYNITKTGTWNASNNYAGDIIYANITFIGIGNYDGKVTRSKDYLVHGKIVAGYANFTTQNYEGEIHYNYPYIDRKLQPWNKCGGPCVGYENLTVYDNKGQVVDLSNFTIPPPDRDCDNTRPNRGGDWDASDNEAGDNMTTIIMVTSKLDDGSCSLRECFWHLDINISHSFIVHGGVQEPTLAAAYSSPIYRSSCNSPQVSTFKVKFIDDNNNPVEGLNLDAVKFYVPEGNCSKYEVGSGVYACDFNPVDSIEPRSYTWTARVIGGDEIGWDKTNYHGSVNMTEKTIEIRGCLNVSIVEPLEGKDFLRGDTIFIKANVTDELGNVINNASVFARIDKNGTGYVDIEMQFNSSSNLWEANYTTASTDKEGVWKIRVNASKDYFDYAEDFASIDVFRQLSISLSKDKDWVYRNDSFAPYQVEFVAHVTDEAGNVSGVTVKFYEGNNFIGENQTNSSGYASIIYNPSDEHEPGNFSIKANVTADHSYSAEDFDWLVIKGLLMPEIESPSEGQKFYKNDTILLNSTIYDENGNIVEASVGWYLEESNELLNQSEDGTWKIPINHGLGNFTINLTANKTYYDLGYDKVNISIWTLANVSLLIQAPQTLYRLSSLELKAEVRDYFNNSPIANYPCKWFANSTNFNITLTNSSGICKVIWNASCDYLLGFYFLNASIQSNSSLFADPKVNNSATNTTLRDKLSIAINSPTSLQILHRTENVSLISSVSDSCASPPTNGYEVRWYNESSLIAQGESTYWQVPANYELGLREINATTVGAYYDTNSTKIQVYIYGWSKVSEITLIGLETGSNSTALAGEIVEVKCKVEDANTTELIQGYTVYFYEFNETGHLIEQAINLTQADGYAYWYWNTSDESEGNYTIKCNITHNSSLYYNASEANELNASMTIERKLYVDEAIFEHRFIYRNDSFSPYKTNITVKITEALLGPAESANASFYESEIGYIGSCLTNSSGYCSITYNPTDTKTPGNYTITINATKSGSNPSDERIEWVVVKGILNIEISKPQADSSFHKTENVTLHAITKDEDGNLIYPTVKWYNSSWQLLAEGGANTDTSWKIPADYKLGKETLHANATQQWYDFAHDEVNITIWGWSEVEVVEPLEGHNYSYGKTTKFVCLARDSNSSKGIENYPIKFFVNSSLHAQALTNSSGYATSTWNPSGLGSFEIKCEIEDNATLWYNASVASDSVSINIIDTAPPEFVNASLNTTQLETYQAIEFEANLTDDINVSSVWVSVALPNGSEKNVSLSKVPGSEYEINATYPTLYGSVWRANYVPEIAGFYLVTFYANDTSGNINVSVTYIFEAVGKTIINISFLPKSISIYNVSQELNQTFKANITCENLGNATAYSLNISVALPVNWTSNVSFPYTCGNVGKSEKCFLPLEITVAKAIPPGNYLLNTTCTWRDADKTINSTSDSINVTVVSNPILEIEEEEIKATVLHASSNTTTFTLNSTGNDKLENVSFECISGVVCNDFEVSFNPPKVSLLEAGSYAIIEVNVSVPLGYNPGNYSGTIKANATATICQIAERCWNEVKINVTVPVSRTWEREPEELVKTVYTNTSGFYGNITLNVTGNIEINFTIGIEGNISGLLNFEPWIIVEKQAAKNLTINYSIPINQTPRTYVGNITIQPSNTENAEPVLQKVEVSLEVKDNIPPKINSFEIIAPSTSGIVDEDREHVTFRANVTDNIEIYKVWVCNGFGCLAMQKVSENIYELNYTFTTPGEKSQHIFAKDTSDNSASSSAKTVRVIPSTFASLPVYPSYKEINITYFENTSFVIWSNFTNLGEGGAYSVNITLSLPDNFTSNSTFEQCGKIEEVNTSDNYCYRAFNITVLAATSPGLYQIRYKAEFINPNGTLATITNTTQIKIISKEWEREPAILEKDVYTNTSGTLNITISNTGEVPLNFTIYNSGNASELIEIPSWIYIENGTSKNLTINYSIPLTYALGLYVQEIKIENLEAHPPSRNTTLKLWVKDNILPVVENTSLSKEILEANYENLDIQADAWDNINISKVWAKIVSAYYTHVVELSYVSGDTYKATYTPEKGGQHNVTIYANDTSNNINYIFAGSFQVKGKTNLTNEQTPQDAGSFATDVNTGGAFSINVTATNIGNATARFVNITLILPEADWSSPTGTHYDCYNLSTGENCSKEIWIDIPVCDEPGTKYVKTNVTWENPDKSIWFKVNETRVTIASNPKMEVPQTAITSSFEDGETKVAGSFDINSEGNKLVTGLAYKAEGGTLPDTWITFNPGSGTQTSLSPCGGSLKVNTSVSVPPHQDFGNYWTKINVTSANAGYDWLWLNITVEKKGDWSREPSFIERETPINSEGEFRINITNDGNLDINFSIYYTGNGTGLLTTMPSYFISHKPLNGDPNPNTEEFVLTYQIPPDQEESLYVIEVTIENTSAYVIPNKLITTIYMHVKDVPPTIHSAFVSPEILDVNYEKIKIEANVSDNSDLNPEVWANITLPNGTEIKKIMQKFGTSPPFTYNTTYIPKISGVYNVTIYAKDSKNLTSNFINISFKAFGHTSLQLKPNVTSINITDITQYSGKEFKINITLNNSYNSSAYFVNVTFELPSSWQAEPSLLDYGNISKNSKKWNITTIKVPAGTVPGNYKVRAIAQWMNANTSFGKSSEEITFNVEPNPRFEIIESNFSAEINHGEMKVLNLTLNSTGNCKVENITINCTSVHCQEFNVSIEPEFISSLEPASAKKINITVKVPFGYPPGNYSLIINASNNKISDSINIIISVPVNESWEIMPKSFNLGKIGTGTKGIAGIINITSLANVNLHFNLTESGNASNFVDTNTTEFNLSAAQKASVLVNYSISETASKGIYTANITVKANTSTPTEKIIQIEMQVVEFRTRIITIEPNFDVSPGDIITIKANTTYENLPLKENVSFEIYFDSYVCQLNESDFSEVDNLWTIKCMAPDIPDGKKYDVKLRSYYSTIDAYSFDVKADALVYKDISPPEVAKVERKHPLPGGNQTIKALIWDNLEVKEVFANITYPNGTSVIYEMKNETSNLANTTWVLNLSNLEEGTYSVKILAKDTSNNTIIKDSWFDVKPRGIIGGTVKNAENNPANTSFEFFRGEGKREIDDLINKTQTDENGNYSVTIHLNRSYDIVVKAFGNTIIFEDVFVSGNMEDPIDLDEIPVRFINPEFVRKVLKGVGVKERFNESKAHITLSFAGKEYSLIDSIRVYKCAEWDFENRKCNTSWVNIGGEINIANETVTVENITGFSAYAAVEAVICGNGICEEAYGENSANCPQDCPSITTTPSGGGGGGGGGGMRVITEIPEIPPAEEKPTPPPFSLETDLIEVSLKPGESRTYSIWISNNLDENVTAKLDVIGRIWEFVQLEKEKVKIGPKETVTVKVKVFTLPTTPVGIYTGDIQVKVGEVIRTIPVTIAVLPEKEALLDLKVSTLTKTITLNGTLKYHVSLYNLGMKKRFDVFLTYRIKDVATERILAHEEETLAIETSLSFVRVFDLSKVKNLKPGKYFIEVEGKYDNRTAKGVDIFEVVQPFWTPERIRLVILVIATGIGIIALFFTRRFYKKWKIRKMRYLMPIAANELPKGKIRLGEVAETKLKAELALDDLTTHVITAGATGSGKTVSAMVIAEEVLKQGIPVVVFDPTAQWTGFLKACRDKRMLAQYKKFGMHEDEARAFKGMIYEITDPKAKIDLRKYLNPGEITIFVLRKLTPEQFDIAVRNIINTIFRQGWEESPTLKLLIVFDEVHRLLEKYGGKGGYIALEKACREFRKWGIGIIMISQVLADFKEAIKGNVLTEMQMHTKGLEDLERIEKKYGKIYAERVTMLEVGTGLIQNPKYNKGRPWFVRFRPLLHEPHKLSDRELELYIKFSKQIEEIEKKIEKMKAKGKDTSDLELELKLTKDKLKVGSFRMAEIYLESLASKVKL